MMTPRAPTFGDVLRRYRTAAGLTQEELAERAGLSAKGISDLERGARTNPRRDTVALIADALALSDQERATIEAAARQRVSASHSSSHQAATGIPFSPRSSGSPQQSDEVPLIGRNDELLLLDQTLRGDAPPLLLFAGEPGIGKSRLLREAARRAMQHGWRVLSGGCHRRSGQEPYAPFVELLDRSLAGHSAAERRTLLQGCSWLSRLLPELGAPTGPEASWVLSPAQERRLTFAAVLRYFRNIASPAGTLLLLDDLQWAGPDALDLLAYLVSTASPSDFRVVAAYRDTDVRTHDPLPQLLADLARMGLASRRLLSPLSTRDTHALAAELVGDGDDVHALRQRLVQRAGGLPFFLVSCAQGLVSGALYADTSRVSDIPWSVAETVRQRVSALPRSAQVVLGIAAVAGRITSRALVMRVAAREGSGDEEILTGLEAACRARLLQEEGVDAYTFAHDLVREVVSADLGTARRAVLHHAIAEALEQGPSPAPPELLAYHYGQSDAHDKALVYLERAGDQARERYANGEAETYYRQLSHQLDTRGRTLEAASIRERLADALARQARLADAAAVLDAAAVSYRSVGDIEGQARVLGALGTTYGQLGLPDEGLTRLEPFVPVAAAAPASSALACFYTGLAAVLYSSTINSRWRADEQLAAAERAIEIASTVGAEHILLDAQDRRATALAWCQRIEESMRVGQKHVIAAAERLGNLAILARALINQGVESGVLGRYEEEHRYSDRARVVAERIDDVVYASYAICRRGVASFSLGNWEAARTDYQEALSLAVRADVWMFSTTPAVALGQLCFLQGKGEEAEAYFAQVRQAGARATDNLIRIDVLYAERDLLEHRPEAARDRLMVSLREPYRANPFFEDVRALLARALVESGDAEQGEALLAEVLATVRTAGLRPSLADALVCRVWIASLPDERGDSARGMAAMEEALALARELPRPYGLAKALYAAGQFLLTRGETSLAREHLHEALTILNRLGERLYAERIERALTLLPK